MELIELLSKLDVQQRFGLISLIALGLGVFLFVYYYRAKGMLAEITTVHPYQAVDLKRLCSHGFDAIVRVEGTVSCDRPITSPATDIECCWCRTRVERQVERNHYDKYGSHTDYEWETAYDQVFSAVFKLSDETGYVLVDPTKANIQANEPVQILENELLPWYMEVGASANGMYRITEELFLPTGHAYVLGQATCCQEGPEPDAIVHYPTHGYTDPRQKYFIISRKTETELTDEESISLKVCMWAGTAAFLIAAFCALRWLGIL